MSNSGSTWSRRERHFLKQEPDVQGGANTITPRDESNPVLILIQKMKLLMSNENDNFAERAMAVRELISFLESILRSKVTSEVFFYLLEHGAATAWVLQVDLDQPEASVYRALKRLRKKDIIVGAFKITTQKGSGGGPRTKVWSIQGADATQVADAIRKHHRALSPKYRVAEEIVQSVISGYLKGRPSQEGITYRKILALVRPELQTYRAGDIAELAAVVLQAQGIKVWR